VGSRLYEALSDHARSLGLTSLWGRIGENDAESLRFAERQGFKEVGREYEVVLDIAGTDVAGEPPPGIELVTIAERPDLVHPLYELDVEVSADVPSLEGGYAPRSFEEWHAIYLEGPGAMPEACVAALAGIEVVGYTGLRRRGPTSPTAANLLTAVRRPWRRRGIATALKRAQIARAHAAGIEQIFHDERRDERRHARRERAARLPAGAGADPRQRPARYVMSRRRVTMTAIAPSPMT
jgi:mycothiol synthase